MADQQKFTLKIPKGYDEEARQAIAEDVIKQIIKRSKSGKDKRNIDFPGYSTSYIKSLDFKNAGKSKKVNLTLSNEMLNSIEYLDSNTGEIEIGFAQDDDLNNAKAEGNILGTYGKKTPIRGKKRDFLGISSEEKKAILAKYPIKTKADRESTSDKVLKSLLATRAAEGIADTFIPIGSDLLGPQ